MEKHQIDQYDMLLAVENHFDDNTAPWTGNAPITASKTLLTENIDLLAAQVALQLAATTGVTTDKNASRQALETLAFTMGAGISSYAAANNKNTLYDRCHYTRSKLGDFRDAELIGVCTNLAADATANLAALAPYGIDASTVTALNSANTDFGNQMKNPTEAIAQRSEATSQIAEMLPNIITNVLERRLDNDIQMIAATESAFVNTYAIVRLINDSPTSTMSATFQSVIQGSNLPLASVKFAITPENIERTTSARGYSSIINLPEGTHHLMAKCPGYAPTDLDFVTVNGSTTEVIIIMVPQ